MVKGESNGYLWLETNGTALADFVARHPRVLQGRHLAVTAHESGPFDPDHELRGSGWTTADGIAYSPLLQTVPRVLCTQFDEWYVFSQQPQLDGVEIFVNYACFTLGDPEARVREAHYTWSAPAIRDMADSVREVQNRFWQQLVRLAPESYLADGDTFIFATNNRPLYRAVESAL